MMLSCIKQQLSNIWNSIYEKVKPGCGWVEKKGWSLKKTVYFCVGKTICVKFLVTAVCILKYFVKT